MLRIFIGYDPEETIAYHVLCHSLMSRASGPLSITPLMQPALRTHGLYSRQRGKYESTEFSLTRFLVPHLSDYAGTSVFMDCDMLALGDIYTLMDQVDPSKAVSVVQHNYIPKTERKMQNQIQSVYPRKNWSSLMVFNNVRCHALTPEFVNHAIPSALHQFAWIRDREIGELPIVWNWLVGEYHKNPDAKMLHFTLGGPWFRNYQFCDHAQEWFDELDKAFPTLNLPKPEVESAKL